MDGDWDDVMLQTCDEGEVMLQTSDVDDHAMPRHHTAAKASEREDVMLQRGRATKVP